jgi:hypothetical protein
VAITPKNIPIISKIQIMHVYNQQAFTSHVHKNGSIETKLMEGVGNLRSYPIKHVWQFKVDGQEFNSV